MPGATNTIGGSTSEKKAKMSSPLGDLSKLPAELRLNIYEDVFADFTITKHDNIARCVGRNNFLPHLLNTGSAVQRDAVRTYEKRLDELLKRAQEETKTKQRLIAATRPRNSSPGFRHQDLKHIVAAARLKEARVRFVRGEELKKMR